MDVVSLKELSGLRDTLMNMQRDVRAPKGFYGMRGKKDYDLVQQKRALLGVAQVCLICEGFGLFSNKRFPTESEWYP